MYTLQICNKKKRKKKKKKNILSLFEVDTLTSPVYFSDFDMPFKNVHLNVGFHNPIPMNIFFNIKDFLYNCKEKVENK